MGTRYELQASVRTAMGNTKIFRSASDASREPDREINSTRVNGCAGAKEVTPEDGGWWRSEGKCQARKVVTVHSTPA